MKLFAITLIVAISLPAASVTFGPGSAVPLPDRVATFDSVSTGTDLSNYEEDQLQITIGNSSYNDFTPGQGFLGGFHYPSGGHPAPTIIKGSDLALFSGVEFTLGTGFFAQMNGTTFVAWETRLLDVVTDSGWFTADLSSEVIVGFSDLAGFDELRVANYEFLEDVQAGIGSQRNAIAIDNLRVGLADVSGVPEPSTLALLGGGLAACIIARKRSTGSL